MLTVHSRKCCQLRHGLSALVVDHREHFLSAVEGSLADARFAVQRARSANAANAALRSSQPDLIVLNCELADESGWLLASKWALHLNPGRIWLYKALQSARDEQWLRYAHVERVLYYAYDAARLTASIRTVAEAGI